MRRLAVLDLFSGIGGFSLGLERAGFETAAFCEIDPHCRGLLAHHWPSIRCYDDIGGLTAERLSADGIVIDAIAGGFPCQPFSGASRGRRVAPDLWPHMARLVQEVRPRFVIAENVSEKPIRRAEQFFRGLGYGAYARRISAADCGADHQRDRWWAVAHPYEDSELRLALDAEVARLPELCRGLWGAENYRRAVRVLDGLPARLDRPAVQALGNAVLPVIPQAIGQAIMAVEAQHLRVAA